MIAYVCTIIAIMSIAIFLGKCTNSTSIKWIPIVYLGIITVLFVFAIFDLLELGRTIIYILSIFSFLRISNKKQEYLQHSNVVYIFLAFMVGAYFYGSKLYVHDEFSHWGTAVKHIYYTKSLYTLNPSGIWFKEYPPALPLMEWFFLSINPSFREDILYMAYYSLVIAILFLPLFMGSRYEYGQNKFVYVINKTGIAFLLLTPLMVWGGTTWNLTILADKIMGVIAAYIIYVQVTEDSKYVKAGAFVFGLFVLSLIKPASIGLVLYVIVVIIIDNIIIKCGLFDWIICVVGIVMSFFSRGLWTQHLHMIGREIKNKGIDVESINSFVEGLFTNNLPKSQLLVVKQILDGLLLPVFNKFPITIPPIFWIIIVFIVNYISFKKKRELNNEKRLFAFVIFSLIFLLIWISGTIYTYINVFGFNEGASAYNRYIPAAMTAIILPWLMVYVNQLNNTRFIITMALTSLMLISISRPNMLYPIINPVYAKHIETDSRNEYADMYIIDSIQPDDSVFLITQDSKYPVSGVVTSRAFYYYRLIPNVITYRMSDASSLLNSDSNLLAENDVFNILRSSGADYVYFYRLYDENIEKLSDYLNTPICQNTYYYIKWEDDAPVLKQVLK